MMMTFEQAWERTSKVEGWLHENEARLLWQACGMAVPESGIVAEVGAYKGRSTTLLGQYAKAVGAKLFVVEPFWYGDSIWESDGTQANQWQYTARVHHQNTRDEFTANIDGLPCVLLEKPSCEVDFGFGIFDFAFIDGDHTAAGVLMDCYKVLPHIKEGGLVAFHDYRPDVFEVKPVVDWACADWKRVGQANELLVLRKSR